jgi:hypothetical protein
MMITSLITVFITTSGIFIVAAFVSLNLNMKDRLNTDRLIKRSPFHTNTTQNQEETPKQKRLDERTNLLLINIVLPALRFTFNRERDSHRL